MENLEGKFYHTKESVEQYIKIADGYDGKELIDRLHKFVPKNSTLLEIGSGPGTDLVILDQIYSVTGSDYSKIFIEILRKNTQLNILYLNAITLETDLIFDGIYSNKVLQHLTNDELIKSIKNQLRILNEDGVVCHSFWKGDICEEMHGSLQNHHTIYEIEDFFSPYFNILTLDVYEELAKNDSILFIGKMK